MALSTVTSRRPTAVYSRFYEVDISVKIRVSSKSSFILSNGFTFVLYYRGNKSAKISGIFYTDV
jgi:hypothetical protein